MWTAQARSDVGNIFASLFENSISYANSWHNELEKQLELLESFPEMGRIVPEKQLKFLREIILGNRYRMVYIYLNSEITIITIRYSSEDSDSLF
jgi:plasmid stabilization system protein ParE